jgi:hypothetical protein
VDEGLKSRDEGPCHRLETEPSRRRDHLKDDVRRDLQIGGVSELEEERVEREEKRRAEEKGVKE